MNINDYIARFGAELDQAECAVLDKLDTCDCSDDDWDKLCAIGSVIGDKWWSYIMLGMIRHRQKRVVEKLSDLI